MTELTLALGEITAQDVDVVVNAANSTLLGGGGVDGAIHRAAGPELLAACRELRATAYPEGLPSGQAVATPGARLPARWVVHAVGPRWSARQDRSAVLASAYATSLAVAAELGARTIAFPAISAGAYGWPVDDAARIAVDTVRASPQLDSFDEVRFVLFSQPVYDAFSAALQRPTGA